MSIIVQKQAVGLIRRDLQFFLSEQPSKGYKAVTIFCIKNSTIIIYVHVETLKPVGVFLSQRQTKRKFKLTSIHQHAIMMMSISNKATGTVPTLEVSLSSILLAVH